MASPIQDKLETAEEQRNRYNLRSRGPVGAEAGAAENVVAGVAYRGDSFSTGTGQLQNSDISASDSETPQSFGAAGDAERHRRRRRRKRRRPAAPPMGGAGSGGRSVALPLAVIVLIFCVSLGVLGAVYVSFPHLDPADVVHVRLPRDMDQAKDFGRVLSKYSASHFAHVWLGYFITYVFLQSFAIPGSIFLSILAGYIFPVWLALLTVCGCSALGASLCYGISHLVGRPLVRRFVPARVDAWRAQVDKQRSHLLNYIIFLRITPFLPNWLVQV